MGENNDFFIIIALDLTMFPDKNKFVEIIIKAIAKDTINFRILC